ncbi:SAM-dependent methyltransferase [Streptomyces sp. DSM 44917]|uniref:SAM-dependent methyltransferase n=1 Tax=Streptomyces boetiae TaxID=3075541 RepID=A0ABU2LFA0_9ACTN|nr:SAM-dependent methyltransferase [Streptomyces sp. DSM 44917]MDT0310125.1 SAM-dependent methyltransferase [Streptomyces sp. DSM 44917]
MEHDGAVPPGIDVTRPSVARVYDYLLGGKSNFAADRELGDVFRTRFPGADVIAQDNRRALARAVSAIARAGVRQFIDIGSGLPSADNVHQIAQRHSPGARVVYVDNDPVVLAHGQALLEENADTAVVSGDLRDPATLHAHPVTRSLIDFDRPVGLILSAILHHLQDAEDPAAVMRFWRGVLPEGSYVFISHFRSREDAESAQLQAVLQGSLGRGRWRTDAEIRRLFEGLRVLPPGIVPSARWRPDAPPGGDLTLWQHLIVAGLATTGAGDETGGGTGDGTRTGAG